MFKEDIQLLKTLNKKMESYITVSICILIYFYEG